MLQVFYWDSYDGNMSSTKYGRTKWIDLIKEVDAINANFDLVWFPPSASGGGVGYNHKQLSNQNSDWGTKAKLVELMDALHKGNTKILGDIVINHRGNKSSWCDFFDDDFKGYGQFQLLQKPRSGFPLRQEQGHEEQGSFFGKCWKLQLFPDKHFLP